MIKMVNRRTFIATVLALPPIAKASQNSEIDKLIRDEKLPRQIWLKRGNEQAIITSMVAKAVSS
jgi:hypothetical protein